MKPNPLISVLMSAYNSQNYIAESIESILNQTYQNFEFIIIDDCSTDQTPQIINRYSDSRIVYIRNNQNLGLTKSLNIGLNYSKGVFIARIDADDIANIDRLILQINYLQTHPTVCCVCSNYYNIDMYGNIISVSLIINSDNWLRWRLLYKNVIAHSSVMINANLLKEMKFNENYTTSQDYELWSRFIQNGLKIHVLPEYLVQIRDHDSRVSKQNQNNQKENALIIITNNLNILLGRVISPGLIRFIADPQLIRNDTIDISCIKLIFEVMMKFFESQNVCTEDKQFIYDSVLNECIHIIRITKTNYISTIKLAISNRRGFFNFKSLIIFNFFLIGIWVKKLIKEILFK